MTETLISISENEKTENEKKYFFDTHAIIDIAQGNKKYLAYKGRPIVTGILNYGEFLYWLLKEDKLKEFTEMLETIKRTTLALDFDDIKDGMKIRFENTKKKLSFVDCVGYAMALRRNLVFVTGDPGFKEMKNVEFIE